MQTNDALQHQPPFRDTVQHVDRNEGAKKSLEEMFWAFDPITLEETNRSARMLKRFDNKYVLDRTQFDAFLSLVHKDFAILEIDGIREFSYSSCYYDDHHRCYLDHHQGKRRRFKVRTREYVDSGAIYFEVKLKGLRGQTDKHRISCSSFSAPEVTGEALDLLSGVYEKNYKNRYAYDLRPELIVDYRRCTLVARRGGERVTIDFALSFSPAQKEGRKVQVGDNFIIVETKSGDGKGLADIIMKNLGIRQASKCSKYCLGVNLTGAVQQSNYFLPMIRRISANLVSCEFVQENLLVTTD